MIVSTPQFELKFQQFPDYLSAHVTGERDTLEISLAYWTAIAHECARLDVRRLLVLEELRERAARGDMRQMVDALLALGFQHIRIAYVDPHEDLGLLDLTEFQARRAGLTGRIFSSPERARGWLLSDLPKAGRPPGEGAQRLAGS